MNNEQWFLAKPLLGKTLIEDASALAKYVLVGEKFIAQLPIKKHRLIEENSMAQRILQSLRCVRSRFIERHAEEVYLILTDYLNKNYSLSDLLFNAAQFFPGILPSVQQIEAEKGHIQAHKEGFEIDQGIFLRGILKNSLSGMHLIDSMLAPSPRALSLLAKLQQTDDINLGLVLVERRGSAAYLTINNQAHLNSENDRLIDDMETAVDLVLLDERIHVGVLRGGVMEHPRYLGKRVFSSGIDLSDLHAGKISFLDFLLKREFGYISKIIHGLLSKPGINNLPGSTIQKPWIAAVDSFAIGGGMQLLLVFDKVIAANDAYFSLPAAQEGIIPGAANFRLPLIVNPRLMRQMLLSGRKIYATDPEAAYFCDEIVPSVEMEARIEAAVKAFDNPAVVENRKMLALAMESRDRFREYMAEFAYVQAIRMNSTDVFARIERWDDSRKKKVSFMETNS